MTFFEFITVFYAIILALVVARSLDALNSVFDSQRRYWVHATWVVIKLMNPFNMWFGIWELRQVDEWNALGTFSLILQPVVLYLQVSCLVSVHAEQIEDWRAHFYGQRVRFFALNLVLILVPPLMAWAVGVGGGAMPTFVLFFWAAIVLFSILGVVTADERVHAAIAVVAALNIASNFVLRVVLGAL